MYKRDFTPEKISELKNNEIFVFGSNLAGQHGGGAAHLAYKRFGAVWGQGVGMQGQSYAIPTMQGDVETIKPYVDDFTQFAQSRPDLLFYVTRIGCGIAGFKDEDIAPLFSSAIEISNILLPEQFVYWINKKLCYDSEMSGMVFHTVSLEFFPEDIEKMESLKDEEKTKFVIELKKKEKYKVKHEIPKESKGSILNCDYQGHHQIAFNDETYAIAAQNKLYSNDFEWGIELPENIVSVTGHKWGFTLLLENGQVFQTFGPNNKKLLFEGFNASGICSGCNGIVAAWNDAGDVKVDFAEDANDDVRAMADNICNWSDIRQIEVGQNHVVGLTRNDTILCCGKEKACEPIRLWRDIKKIYVPRLSVGTCDFTVAIQNDGWLLVDGECWAKASGFWKKIRAQYDVNDIIMDDCETLVRYDDGSTRWIYYYSPLCSYNFNLNEFPGFQYVNIDRGRVVLVDSSGEFIYHRKCKTVNWWKK